MSVSSSLQLATATLLWGIAIATPCGSLNRGSLVSINGNGVCRCDTHVRDGNFDSDQPNANREVAAFNIIKSGDNKCLTYSTVNHNVVLSADCGGRGLVFIRTADGKIQVVGGVPQQLLGGCLVVQGNFGGQGNIGVGNCDANNAIDQFRIQTEPGLYQIRATGSDYWSTVCSQVRQNGNSGCQFVNQGGAPFTAEGTRMLFFAAHNDESRVYYHASAPVDQRCAVYDASYNPSSPTTAPTAPTAAPTAYPTRWFAHPDTQVTLNNLTDAVVQLSAENQQLRNELRTRTAELETAIAGNASMIQSTLSTQVASLRDVIEGALAGLPEDGGDDGSNPEAAGCSSDAECTPVVEADGRNLNFRTPGGIVNMHTSNCGSFDPCAMLTALKDMRRSLINEEL